MKNLVGLWVNLFRGIEIAKTGGHSISIHFGVDYKNGFDDYDYIKIFCKDWFSNFVSNGDIKIEISKPRSYELKNNCETLSDISSRIEKALKFTKPEFKVSDSTNALLVSATEKLELSLFQVERIKEISTTIAQLDYSEKIEAYHVAEAIQYSYISKNSCYNAENKSKIFSDMIQIKVGEIDEEQIKLAINYLNELL